jgi:hypothetical protein
MTVEIGTDAAQFPEKNIVVAVQFLEMSGNVILGAA